MKRIMTVFLSVLIVLSSLTCVFIAPVSAATNLWSGISAADWYTRQVSTKVDDPLTLQERKLTDVYPEKFTYGGGTFSLEGASGKYIYVKLPVLAKNKEFTLSFDYSVTAASSGTPTMYKVILMPESAFTNSVTWNGFGAMLSGRSFLGAYDLFIDKPLDSNNGTVSYTFNTKTQAQYYLYLEFNNVDTITYSKFKLVDPTDTTPDEEEDENPADVWTNVVVDDFRTRHVHTKYDDGRTIPEKSVAENYPGDFVYNSDSNEFTLKNAHGRHHFIKMPILTKNKDYSLSVKYTVNAGNKTNPMLYKVLLVPKSAFTDKNCWNGFGEIFADRSWIGIQNVIIQKSIVGETSGVISYDFNTGKYDNYYLFVMFNNIETLTYTNFEVIDPDLVVEEPENPPVVPEEPEIPDEIPPYSTDKTNIWTEYSVDDWFTKQTTEVYTDGRDIPEKSASEAYGDDFAYDEATKSFSLKNAGNRYYYVKLPELEKNKNYVLGFDYITTLNKNKNGKFNKAILVPKAQFGHEHCWNTRGEVWADRHFIALKDIVGGKDDGLAPGGIEITEENRKGSIDFIFNSGMYTEYYLFLMINDIKNVTYHNLEVSEPVNLDVVADLGGTVKTTQSGLIVTNTEVTVTATPDKGNTFKHWLDNDGMVVSTDAEYTFKVEKSTYLKAVFGGYNKPSRELFALRGDDGTFENGSISGMIFPDNDLGFCKAEVSDAYAFEGTKSFAITSYYRTAVLPLTGLNKNTDYKFSYYIKYPYTGTQDERNHVQGMMICGANDLSSENPEKVFAEATSYLAGDAGWYKVEFYFNSGDNTAVNYILKYSGEPKKAAKVYIDNVCLYEYYSAKELLNGSMTDDIAPWLGEGEIVDNTLKLSGEKATAYQILGLDAHSRYTVKFRAKGNVFAAFSDVAAKVPNIYNAISSKSYLQANSSAFKNYSIEVYTGVHKGVALMFSSLGGDVFVDNVTVTKELSAIGGVIENVDFETDRFALTHTDSSRYEIYTAKSAKDNNVRSGKKSLHFKYNSKEDVEAILDEAYLSYGVAYNHNYTLSLYYKFDSDTKEAAVNLEPNYRASYYNGDYGDYSGEIGYKQPTTKGEWKRLAFVFTARDFGVLKAAVYNIVGKTDADFYLDDIVITVASDLVVDEKTEKAYTTDFYNMFTNPSFEKSLVNTNWTNMPKTMQIVRNKTLADTADSFLKVAEGTKYILPITLNPSEVYYFGTSIRTFNGGKGRIYLATLVEPSTLYFTDLDNNPKSIITADGEEWKHEGFGFRASPTGETYLVVECTEGAIGIDTVSLTLEIHANPMDYNQYYPHIPFDYDNIPAAMIVYNGGLDVDVNDAFEEEFSPSTGDSIKVVSIIFISCLAAAATMIFTKKRKDETDA